MFEYGIEIDGELIASFKNESDRDVCLTTLIETFDDCNVQPVYCGE